MEFIGFSWLLNLVLVVTLTATLTYATLFLVL